MTRTTRPLIKMIMVKHKKAAYLKHFKHAAFFTKYFLGIKSPSDHECDEYATHFFAANQNQT